MKTTLYDASGSKKGTIELPSIFSTKIRQDIAQKYFEASKEKAPYFPNPEAGKHHSASGTISHQRHQWKGHYGRGISRVPRKTMWRRGTQFYWIGAEISSARGGRRAHPPKITRIPKINKKEMQLAMASAFASTANIQLIKKRYSSLEKLDSAPFIIESLPKKTSSILSVLETIKLPTPKDKEVRPGKGKLRGRKYKTNPGILILTGKDEKIKSKGLDIKTIKEVTISDLYPLGRLTLFTKKAIEELGAKNVA